MVDFKNILSVDAHPTLPGASLVKFRDGSSMAAPASVADKFKPSVFGAGATADSGFFPPTQSPVATDATPPAPIPQAAPVATPQAAVPPLSRGQAPSTYDSDLGLPQYEIDRINRPKYVAGHAAYDPGADNASRQAVAERKTDQRQGVGYWDEESRLNDVINAREAQSAELEAKSMAMQANREAQALAYADQQKALADETARRQAEEQSWQAENDRLNQEAKAIATREIDPGRAFRDASPFQTIALTIAAGMRGFATSGRDTAVMDSVQRMIDRDVAAQENDIARAKGNADNALARNVQRYGSIEAGKAALKLQQTQVAAAKFDATVAALGENADKAKLEAERQKFDAAIYSRYNELKAAAMGTTSEAIDSSMRAPQAAVAGGFVAPSEDEIDRRTTKAIARQSGGADLSNKRLTNESKALENEFTRAKGVTPEQDAKRQDTITTAVKDYGTKRAASEAARAQMERFVAENKLETDEKGNIKTPSDIAGFGFAGQHNPGATTSHQGVVNRSTLNELVANVAISRFGAYNPEQGKTIREEIIGDGRPETLAVNINNMRRKLIEENKNLNASFSPEVRAQYDKNKTSFTKSTDSKAKLFKPVSP